MKSSSIFHPGVQTMGPLKFNSRDESSMLYRLVRSCNEATEGRGLKFLRSLLSNVVQHPRFAAAKPLYAAVNSADPSSSVAIAKALLSQTYESHEEQFVMSQIACFVKKYPFTGGDESRRQAALDKFYRGERRNRHLNALVRARRLVVSYDHSSRSGKPLVPGCDADPFVDLMRRFIRRVIGDKPNYQRIFGASRWGPGAVGGVSGQFTNFARKLLSEEWTVTPTAVPYVLTAARRLPMFWELLGLTRPRADGVPVMCIDLDEFDKRFMARLVYVQHNTIVTVPKDSGSDRTISPEPLMNQLVQLGTDNELKLLLRRVKIDLTKQWRNQEMARLGSILGAPNPYCTADLSNASGSIFTELIRELFPQEWWIFLNSTRSPSYSLDQADPVKYHGFVSMGNGFCFPVETLIFASICSAACTVNGTPQDFTVYGDDIIVRRSEADHLKYYLRRFGFELNADKSFFDGPFRESCGADWYNGKPVRPVYIKNALDSLEERVRVHNAFARAPLYGAFLSAACRDWFPPFFVENFVRPFGDETDEALDNRHETFVASSHWCKTYRTPAWYGLVFSPLRDKEIEQAIGYNVALVYGALSGSRSDAPFVARRETRMTVTRFSHGGGSSYMLPHEDGRRETTHRGYWKRPWMRLANT